MSDQFYKILDTNGKTIFYNRQIRSIRTPTPNLVSFLNEEGDVIAVWPVSQIHSIELVQTENDGGN